MAARHSPPEADTGARWETVQYRTLAVQGDHSHAMIAKVDKRSQTFQQLRTAAAVNYTASQSTRRRERGGSDNHFAPSTAIGKTYLYRSSFLARAELNLSENRPPVGGNSWAEREREIMGIR